MISIATVVLSSLLLAARAETIDIAWRVQPYEDMTATVGDTVTFTWTGTHNVFIHPTGDCSEDGADEVGTSSPASYTFEADDVGEIYFACDISSHCESGQIVRFVVSEGSTPTMPPPPPVMTPTPTPGTNPEPPTMATPAPAATPTLSPTTAEPSTSGVSKHGLETILIGFAVVAAFVSL